MTAPCASRLAAVILAAGKGTRMHSDKPKVLHSLLGEPMLWYVLRALRCVPALGSEGAAGDVFTVAGHRAEQVQALFPDERLVLQEEQLGTGHALRCAWPEILARGTGWCLVVNGDAPLIDPAVIQRFCETMIRNRADVGFLTLTLPDPGAYGRVVRDGAGRIAGIAEARDHDPARHGLATGEVNAGVYLLRVEAAGPLLSLISADNSQGEYYLTDLVGLAAGRGLRIAAMDAGQAGDAAAFLGVNSLAELAASEDELQRRIVSRWLNHGVTIHFQASVRIGPRVILEPGAEVFGPCELYGQSVICAGAVVESHTWLKDSQIGPGSRVRSFSHMEGATLGENCIAGPFARLRPGAVLEEGARVGNFVEMKKARLGAGAKANHLSYLGDAEVGPGANIGAGTITCNYDGRRKHRTGIGAGAFIGSNTALVAPVQVGENALVGAGSVITKDVPDGCMAVARGRQKNILRQGEEG